MPPINLYTNSAINAAKASSVTPQEASDFQQDDPLTAENKLPPPTTNNYISPYPVARPGAPPVPAPTAAAQRYAPPSVQPTPTATFDAIPPPPQPGSFPTPLNPSTRPKSNIPPPPKAGEKFVQPPRTENIPASQHSQRYPSQMYMPPPTTVYGPQPPPSMTSTTTTPSTLYPVSIHTEGPPGYRQNQDTGASALDDELDESESGATSLAEDAAGVWNMVKTLMGIPE